MGAELGRRACGGWWVAAPFVRPKRALPLGVWVERLAPAGGAIRTSEWSDSHHPTYGMTESPSSIGGKLYEKSSTIRLSTRGRANFC